MSFSVRRLEEPRRKRRTIPWQKMLALTLLLTRPLAAFVRKMEKKRQGKERWKRFLTVGTAIIVGASILLVAFALLVRIGALSLSSFANITGAPLQADSGTTNILLLGQGNEDHDGIDLTDTIMVASIDGDGKSVVLLSLPRDLYFLHADSLTIKKGKLNALWRDERIALRRAGLERREASLKALQGVAHEVGEALGIPVHYTVKVDFTAFEQIIDALGGIDIAVPEAMDDMEYPGPNYTFEPFHIAAGLQNLDGAAALKYARTRHTSSDFDRSARQQQILQALNEKAKSSGLLKKPG
ncbi:MAG: LCP family protein, partial [Patescibacteria group bacterium]